MFGAATVIGGQMNHRYISTVCGTALMLATSGAVIAADMAVKEPPPPAVWDWSGFYIGVGGSFTGPASTKRFKAYPTP